MNWERITEHTIFNDAYKDFRLFHLDDTKRIFVVCKNYKKLAEFVDELEKIIRKLKFEGEVVIDKLSYTSNKDRFISVTFRNGNFIWNTSKPTIGSVNMRCLTSYYFYKHPDLLSNTLMTREQKDKIRRDIVI